METKTLTGLTPGVTYYIAIETIDEKPNQAIDFNKTGNSAMAQLMCYQTVCYYKFIYFY